MKKAALVRRQERSGHGVQRLYKGVRVVQVVIVEDVLVLAYVRLVRHVRLVHGVSLVGVQLLHTAGDQAGQVKGIFLVRLRRIAVIGVLLQVVLGGEKGPQPPEL